MRQRWRRSGVGDLQVSIAADELRGVARRTATIAARSALGGGISTHPLRRRPICDALPPSPAFPSRRSIHDGKGFGASFFGPSTRGRLEGCDIARNADDGVSISDGADSSIVSCK